MSETRTREETEQIVKLFFGERFPNKDIEFEKRCGYFYEWVNRFESGDPTIYMDKESKRAYEKIISATKTGGIKQ